jgi:hypothetical protein
MVAGRRGGWSRWGLLLGYFGVTLKQEQGAVEIKASVSNFSVSKTRIGLILFVVLDVEGHLGRLVPS